MDKLDCMNTFISVVETGNFSQASRHLNISRDKVAKQICYLELLFSTTLFIRHTRRMDLTSAGEKFYQHCKVIMSEYEWASNDFLYEQKYPEGQLKINVPYSFGQIFLSDIINKFMNKYPNIKIELFLSDKFLDIQEEAFDITIGFSQKIDKKNAYILSTFNRYFYASPKYLQKNGTPQNTNDLKQHSFLFYSQKNLDTKIVLFKNGEQHTFFGTPKLTSNSGEFLLNFCKLGQGIVFIPSYLAEADENEGKIVRCLPDYQTSQLYIYAIAPKTQNTSKKVKIFLNYLKDYFSKN